MAHLSGKRRPLLDRRQFLGVGGAAGLGLLAAGLSAAPVAAQPRFPGDPFTLGVASGDPLPDGVVLWTRLAPDPLALDGRGGMPDSQVVVEWEIAEDERFTTGRRAGTAPATPELGHSVHVEVAGLRPGREYFYRFRTGGEDSPVGRTRTAPPADAQLDRFRFAFVSCQAWPDGYYTAYEHLTADDLDLVVHLGDYLYEYGVGEDGGVRDQRLPDQYLTETYSLVDYRNRHALYRLDANLQAAHAAFPWAVTWDDHELENNWAGDASEEDEEPDQNPEEFLKRKSAAFQAYYEHLPLRRPQRPQGPRLELYRRLDFGRIARINLLDTRSYRSDQACGDGRHVDCEERLDPSRTILGDEQERWLLEGLSASPAGWNVLAQQTMIAQLDHDPGAPQAMGMDLWDGYKPARDRLLREIADRQVRNPVVITGDIHRSITANLTTNFDDPDAPVVGAEFAGSSVSSGGDGSDMDDLGRDFLAANPHLLFNNTQRCYVRCTLTPDAWQTEYRVLPYVTRPGAPISTRATFVVEDGVPGVQGV